MVQAIRLGAVGFLSKHLAPHALVTTLHAFQEGRGLPISRDAGILVLRHLRRGSAGDDLQQQQPRLTDREREVLALVAAGARDRDIAARLVVSESTVKKHVQNILRKFQARNRAEAVALWRSSSAPIVSSRS